MYASAEAAASSVVRRALDSLGRDTAFVHGAFVLEDDSTRGLFRALLASRHTVCRWGAFTHAAFSRISDPVPWEYSGQWEYRFPKPILVFGESHKRIALFYTFSVMRRNYLFLKLEEWPYDTFQHAVDAFRAYILRPPPTGAYPERREDVRRRRSHWHHPALEEAARFYDTHVRRGSEVFVATSSCITRG